MNKKDDLVCSHQYWENGKYHRCTNRRAREAKMCHNCLLRDKKITERPRFYPSKTNPEVVLDLEA